MLTARGDETDRVVGLELGADDYVSKPFSPRELLARLRAVLRRAGAQTEAERLVAAGVEIDVGARSVRCDGADVELTGLEFDVLVALMRRAGRVIPRSALLAYAGDLRETGIPVCPSGSAGLAGLLSLRESGALDPGEVAAVLFTGVQR